VDAGTLTIEQVNATTRSVKPGGPEPQPFDPSAYLFGAQLNNFPAAAQECISQRRDFANMYGWLALMTANSEGFEHRDVKRTCAFSPFGIVSLSQQCGQPRLQIWTIHNASTQRASVLTSRSAELGHIERRCLHGGIVLKAVRQHLVLQFTNNCSLLLFLLHTEYTLRR
jgi:hypothetical protein